MLTSSATATSRTLRPALSLTTGEGLLAFAAGATAYLLLRPFFALPFWVSLVLCNTLALSAVCARRYLRREEAPALSRFGYGALAHPLLHAFLFVWVVATGGMSVGTRVTFFTVLAIGALVAALVTQIAVAGTATMRGLWSAEYRGEIAALPLCLVWIYALGFIVFSGGGPLKATTVARVGGATGALKPFKKHDISMDKFAEAWVARYGIRPARVRFDVTYYPNYAEGPGDVWAFSGAELFEMRNGAYVRRALYRRDDEGVGWETLAPIVFDSYMGRYRNERDPSWDDSLKPVNCDKAEGVSLDTGANGRARK